MALAITAAALFGAIIGSFAIIGVLGDQASEVGLGVAAFGPGVGAGQAFVAEFVGTFILVFTIFGVIHKAAAPGFAGIAIGLVVFAAIIPVRTLGPMIVQQLWGGEVAWSQAPVYLLAEVSAGIAAALIYVTITRTRELPEPVVSPPAPVSNTTTSV